MSFGAAQLCLGLDASGSGGWDLVGRFARVERPDVPYPLAELGDVLSIGERDQGDLSPPLTYRRLVARSGVDDADERILRGLLLVMVDNLDPSREAAFHDWYDTVHVPDVLQPGTFFRATRYEAVTDCPARYLALYETDWDDPGAAHREMATSAGEMQMWDALSAVHVASYRLLQT